MNIPGFTDLQVNGYKGVDFSASGLTAERFLFACRKLIGHGTAVFLPTVITSSPEIYRQNLSLISQLMEHEDLKNHLPGIHLEGPFISPEDGARGAHNREWVQEPDLNLLDQLYEWSGEKIKLLTIAAELDGAEALCRHAADLGITVSLGHQMASEIELDKLSSAGARSLTHLGNGLPKLLPRHKNPLWAGLGNDALTAMVIADGHHLPPSILKTIIRTKGIEKVCVVSDASPIAGLSPGRYNTLGNEVVLEDSGRLYNPDTGYLVGSSSTMLECMNYLLSLDLLTDKELFEVGFYNPLRLIDIDPSSIIDNFPSYVEKEDRFILNAGG